MSFSFLSLFKGLSTPHELCLHVLHQVLQLVHLLLLLLEALLVGLLLSLVMDLYVLAFLMELF